MKLSRVALDGRDRLVSYLSKVEKWSMLSQKKAQVVRRGGAHADACVVCFEFCTRNVLCEENCSGSRNRLSEQSTPRLWC